MSENIKGKMIVIEGGDGSGKATQAQLLLEYLKKHNIPHSYVDFPNYSSFFGQMIGDFLRGEYGSLEQVSPYIAALLFALDRNAMKEHILSELEQGKIVVANRYVSSNMAHQGSKFKDKKELDTFLQWLERLEFEIHGLPREDIVILLQVPWQTAHTLTIQKEDREYLKGKKEDIQEQDINHRKDTENMYTYLAQTHSNWTIIPCTEHDTIISKEKIHEKVVAVLKEHNIIS